MQFEHIFDLSLLGWCLPWSAHFHPVNNCSKIDVYYKSVFAIEASCLFCLTFLFPPFCSSNLKILANWWLNNDHIFFCDAFCACPRSDFHSAVLGGSFFLHVLWPSSLLSSLFPPEIACITILEHGIKYTIWYDNKHLFGWINVQLWLLFLFLMTAPWTNDRFCFEWFFVLF